MAVNTLKIGHSAKLSNFCLVVIHGILVAYSWNFVFLYYYYKILNRSSSKLARVITLWQGRRLREGQGQSSPQKVRWRGRRCFYPPVLRKCVASLHCKRIRMRKKENENHETHVTVTDIPALSYSHILRHCLD